MRYHVPAESRDGVRLATDVYLSDGEGRFPTLLVRDTCSNGSAAVRQQYAPFATSNSYSFVFQSARGRYGSEGKRYPYLQEINEGDATLTWIADQSWSDGRWGCLDLPTLPRCNGLPR